MDKAIIFNGAKAFKLVNKQFKKLVEEHSIWASLGDELFTSVHRMRWYKKRSSTPAQVVGELMETFELWEYLHDWQLHMGLPTC